MNHGRPILHAFTQPISPAYPHPASPSTYNDRHPRAVNHHSQPLSAITPTSVPVHVHAFRGSPTGAAPQRAHTYDTQLSQPTTPPGIPTSYTRTPANGHKDPSSPFSHRRSQSGAGYTTSSPADNFVRSESDRDKSVSVSPKTKISSRTTSMDMKVINGRGQDSLGYSMSPTSARYNGGDRQRLSNTAQRKNSLVALPDQSVALNRSADYHQQVSPQQYTHLEYSQMDGNHNRLPQSPEKYSNMQNHTQTVRKSISRNASSSSNKMEVMTPLAKTQHDQKFTIVPSNKFQHAERDQNAVEPAAHLDINNTPPTSRPVKSPINDAVDLKSARSRPRLDHSQSPKLQSATKAEDVRNEEETKRMHTYFQSKSPEPAKRKRTVPAWALRASPGQITSMKQSGGQHNQHISPRTQRQTYLNGHQNSGEPGTEGSSHEPSITLEQPYDEVTRELCDFLDAFVVSNDGWRSLEGVKLEIEAKIGTLVDDVTGERLSLPIRTETVLDSNKIQVRFQSFITVEHHKSINGFLNDAFTKSQTASSTPMKYKHTKERDVFYEFYPETHFAHLPPSAQNIIKPTNHTRIRVTRDDESGADISKIVKHRVEDLSIYSPGTEFDYRISLNLEFPFHGPTNNLIEAKERGAKKERLKDRMTYWHQDFRIDFTQAKPSEVKTDWTHELEIELDEQKLYHCGKNDRLAYERYVGGLVNNLRVLARSTKDSFVAGA